MELQIILPGVERFARDELREANERARLPDHEFVLGRQARGGEEGTPIKVRRLDGKSRPVPVIVAGLNLFRCGPRPVHLRHAPLELEDFRGTLIRRVDTGRIEHGGDMRDVLRPDRSHRGGGAQVVFPIRHRQSALHQEGHVAFGVVQILRHPQPEKMRCMQVGVVQYVHVRTHGFAQCGRQFVAAEDAVDALECRLHDFESLGLDRGLV